MQLVYIGSQISINVHVVGNCPPERPEVQCPYNPCEYEVCSNFPDAECMFDSCGQCKARFFDGDTEVTQQCGME